VEFQGRTKRKEQLDHLKTLHPEFWNWRGKFNKVVDSTGIIFVVFLVVGAVLQGLYGKNAVPSWYLPTFIAMVAIILASLPYYQWRARRFKRDWTEQRPASIYNDLKGSFEETGRKEKLVPKKPRTGRLLAPLVALLGLFIVTGSLAYGDTIPICSTAPLSVGSCMILIVTFWVGIGMVAISFAYTMRILARGLRRYRQLRKTWKQARQKERQDQ
jgi:protein-S-isoprenylcysteine O-methyltransferase Ste14